MIPLTQEQTNNLKEKIESKCGTLTCTTKQESYIIALFDKAATKSDLNTIIEVVAKKLKTSGHASIKKWSASLVIKTLNRIIYK